MDGAWRGGLTMVDGIIDGDEISTAEDTDSNAIFRHRLELAMAWRSTLSDHQRLAQHEIYIRIREKDFRAISLDPCNPCGRLMHRGGSDIKGYTDIHKAILSAGQSASTGYVPGNKKPEHRIQAFLIREALTHDLRFGHVFHGFETKFDELIFVTDEIRLNNGKLRADIIAIGVVQNSYFPILIELKCGRLLTKLVNQLNNARDWLQSGHSAQSNFHEFLCAVSGVAEISPFKDMLRLIIWPASESGKEAKGVAAARASGILIAQYSQHSSGGYKFALDHATNSTAEKADH
jgi:hypothetical protein